MIMFMDSINAFYFYEKHYIVPTFSSTKIKSEQLYNMTKLKNLSSRNMMVNYYLDQVSNDLYISIQISSNKKIKYFILYKMKKKRNSKINNNITQGYIDF